MTIVVDIPIRRLPYRGYDDPSLPVGIWWGSGVLVGDASGGTQQIRFLAKVEGDPVSGDMLNLEQIMAFVSTSTATSAFLSPVGFSPSRELPGVDALYRFQLDNLSSALGNSAIGHEHPKLPIFIGATRGGADTLSTIAFGITNLTATDSLSVSMMGYIWEARSLLAPGGLQRPPNGLFGNS